MTVIALGTVTLRVGMTLFEAQSNDEKIKQANGGKAPADKKGKQYQTNVALFKKYDANKNGIIEQNEYANYRNDMAEQAKKQMAKANKDVQNLWDAFKAGKNESNKQKSNYVL